MDAAFNYLLVKPFPNINYCSAIIKIIDNLTYAIEQMRISCEFNKH